jgi:hypothetical protein
VTSKGEDCEYEEANAHPTTIVKIGLVSEIEKIAQSTSSRKVHIGY